MIVLAVDTTLRRQITRRRFLEYGITAAAVAGAFGATGFPHFQGLKGGGGYTGTHSLVTSNGVKPSIVFAHGLWADGSCFSKVIPSLQADGYEFQSYLKDKILYRIPTRWNVYYVLSESSLIL